MKTLNKLFKITTNKRYDIVNITQNVKDAVAESKIKEGFVLVYPMHTTSGVFINDVDGSLLDDIIDFMEKLVPEDSDYRHNGPHEANADGHIRQMIAGHNTTLPIIDGRLFLGTWQTIYYAEYDGQREKDYLVKVLGE
ncbi:MAG: secondary thiamine-phosphate synthase enzyme [Candidatus Muiribacterium halophilum]|uniref:Secondary thiamine-phosphate synthase enzyme n=1 Tax=Muiribacterium halophilum TaxID=2053465 RepID=A0A2N5ZJ31_MUIH1|nr:MAG: secondary thiamine-phosphate synthase enzyme [Candidatus Muirbacterium halophilum]